MNAIETFEERVTPTLDALYDGARLLTRNDDRAEALVVETVVNASRRYRRVERPADFRKWIIGRLVRGYMDQLEDLDSGDGGPAARSSVFGTMPHAGADTAGWTLESLLANLEPLERNEPDQLGHSIRRAMNELALTERTSLWLVNVMGFGYSDAARALGMRKADLRDALLRARSELQVRMVAELRDAASRMRRHG